MSHHSQIPSPDISFTADAGDARRRLDLVLVRRLGASSRVTRTQAQRWIREGRVRVDGRRRMRPADVVAAGARIEVDVPQAARRTKPAAEPLPLDVLYEDDWLLAVNKPPGVVVHPTYKHSEGTLLGRVLWHLRARTDATPGIVSRLDKDTSGVLLVALAPAVHAQMQRQSAAGRLVKEYLAVVDGSPRPTSGIIALPLARDPDDRRRVVVAGGGQPSETRYEVVSEEEGIALVRCTLITGRTHQIRVHLSARGWPIVGDRVYGNADPRIDRQALHAWRVTFTHPASATVVGVTAPLPADMRAVIESDQKIEDRR